MQHRAHEAETTTVPGLSDLGPSFLSLDVEGRVVRLDTFSKCLAISIFGDRYSLLRRLYQKPDKCTIASMTQRSK